VAKDDPVGMEIARDTYPKASAMRGVAANMKLPASLASLGTIPAQVTLPISCGRIERLK
jgi:hypothetical protein